MDPPEPLLEVPPAVMALRNALLEVFGDSDDEGIVALSLGLAASTAASADGADGAASASAAERTTASAASAAATTATTTSTPAPTASTDRTPGTSSTPTEVPLSRFGLVNLTSPDGPDVAASTTPDAPDVAASSDDGRKRQRT